MKKKAVRKVSKKPAKKTVKRKAVKKASKKPVDNRIKVFRHGDVMIIETKDAPGEDVEFTPASVLHKGDNHSHDIAKGSALVGVSTDGRKWLRCSSQVTLDHVEHGKGVLPKGLYLVTIKKEYDHFLEESMSVRD